jgi:sporulation protein YlmC with PRC-barrel domain
MDGLGHSVQMEEIMLDTTKSSKLVLCLAFLLSATTLEAQQNATAPPRQRGDLDAIRKVSTLLGTDVMNSSSSKIATVRNVAFAPEGALLYVVLGCGGLAGVGETYTAVPVDALAIHHDNGKWAVELDMSAEDVKKAPTMQSENCRELMDDKWIARIDQFFRPRTSARENAQAAGQARQGERQAVERLLLATKIRSGKIANNRSEDLGKIEDLLLDKRYRAVFAIIGQGGVLGIGESFIPVPWTKLGFNVNRDANAVKVTIDIAKDQLEKAPLVKGDNYATLLAPGFATAVRHYFGVAEKSSTNDDRDGERPARD